MAPARNLLSSNPSFDYHLCFESIIIAIISRGLIVITHINKWLINYKLWSILIWPNETTVRYSVSTGHTKSKPYK